MSIEISTILVWIGLPVAPPGGMHEREDRDWNRNGVTFFQDKTPFFLSRRPNEILYFPCPDCFFTKIKTPFLLCSAPQGKISIFPPPSNTPLDCNNVNPFFFQKGGLVLRQMTSGFWSKSGRSNHPSSGKRMVQSIPVLGASPGLKRARYEVYMYGWRSSDENVIFQR